MATSKTLIYEKITSIWALWDHEVIMFSTKNSDIWANKHRRAIFLKYHLPCTRYIVQGTQHVFLQGFASAYLFFLIDTLAQRIVVVHSLRRYRFRIDLRQGRIGLCTRSPRIFTNRVLLLCPISEVRSCTTPVVRSFDSVRKLYGRVFLVYFNFFINSNKPLRSFCKNIYVWYFKSLLKPHVW